MGEYLSQRKKISVSSIRQSKEKSKKISMVTCYDATFAHLVNQANIDVVLVGDSLANVVLGHTSTVKATMSDMLHHGAAVSRSIQTAHICVDMPFMSYRISPSETLKNAMRLVQAGGAESVKVEGAVTSMIATLTAADVPVMGHLGLTPQSIHSLGGYRVQGRAAAAARKIVEDAKRIEDAGAYALVLEMVPAELAQEITQSLEIPTIGIGAGAYCDGQVLVLYDLLGLNPDFNPKFLKKFANLGHQVVDALNQFQHEVQHGSFPSACHSFAQKREIKDNQAVACE
ncbi:MAG: 3-methyl-2-oxobutanoate hydroxymethyltransferase [Zetaproteobacteria bacterium]|nr:3-methyl-2-oxobutanoate hydroxymethyltransferase [Zetaproteobacteria bacterium]